MRKWTNIKKMMIIGVLAAIVILFLLLSGFSLHKTADRPSVAYPLSEEMKGQIAAETMDKDERELIEYALSLTAKSLQFAAKNDIEGGSAEVLTMLMPNERWRNFVKDHDFMEIETGNSIIYVDPSLYDFHVDCTTVVNKK